MSEKPKGSTIHYHPSEENRLFILKMQNELTETGPDVGLDRVVDKIITELRKSKL